MDFDSFIGQLANGPFVVFAFVIGIIVSVDVSVVELTRQYPEKKPGEIFNSRKLWMAFWHALFHSASFFLYMSVIYVFQKFIFIPIDLFDVPVGVGVAVISVVNFLIVCFVWWTYRDKIKEDHSDKASDETAVDRRDMRLLVDLVRAIAQKFGITDGARGISIAGAVAVDMLAVGALLKTYLLPNGDNFPISTLTGFLLIDIFIFASIIFFVVCAVVFIAQTLGQDLREFLSQFNFIAALRLFEPFAVFVIVSGALRYLLEFYSGQPSGITGFWGYIFDAAFSLAIVFSLVISTGLSWSELNAIYSKVNYDEKATNPEISFSMIWADLRRLIPLVVWLFVSFAVIVSIIIYSFSTVEGPNSHNHLVESTAFVATLGLFGSIIFLYMPSRALDRLETDQSTGLAAIQGEGVRQIWSRFSGVLTALALFNVLNIAFAGWETAEVQAIAFWSGYVLLTMLLFDLRRWRFCKAGLSGSPNGRQNDALFAEVVSAFGVASSLVALLSTVFVTTLIG
ncbi:hypothetical protein [Erythrobacter sp. BLCC-B19]|uniref:hypothetical protein n=1 Tax=Erythrobacter sp. BLCC-B19 TaxID=3025315 RepID=UPI00235E6839|nr:hypothetical protein [Erythrobacter sp. BLCC-B19]WDA42379.1 hypothetical protein PS060_06105 [Erythrobacter sp. BLCC-B19]